MNMRAWTVLLGAALLAAAGCGGPVHTTAAQGLDAHQASRVMIPHNPPVYDAQGEQAQIPKVNIDGREYRVKRDQDFWVTPGRHGFRIYYHRRVSGPHTWFCDRWQFLRVGVPQADLVLEAVAGQSYRLEAATSGKGSGAVTRQRFVEVAPEPPTGK